MAGKKSVRDARSSGQVAELPDGPPDASGLTPRQQRVLTVRVENRGGEAAKNVRLRVSLPSQVSLVQA